MKRYKVIVTCVLLANTAASNVYAACFFKSESMVRARFVRCEDAKFYIEARNAREREVRTLENALDPRSQDEFRKRIDVEAPLPPGDHARVAVVMVDWRVKIAPWLAASEAIKVLAQPQELYENVRYWWNADVAACEGIAPGASIDLWVRTPCCDTIPGSPMCAVQMNYAEPAPEKMRETLSAVLSVR